jgi:hypothetical protein
MYLRLPRLHHHHHHHHHHTTTTTRILFVVVVVVQVAIAQSPSPRRPVDDAIPLLQLLCRPTLLHNARLVYELISASRLSAAQPDFGICCCCCCHWYCCQLPCPPYGSPHHLTPQLQTHPQLHPYLMLCCGIVTLTPTPPETAYLSLSVAVAHSAQFSVCRFVSFADCTSS